MTAKQYAPGTTHNKHGNGKGMKSVTKPAPKKRGSGTAKVPAVIAENRKKYRSATNIPVAEIADSIDPNKPLTEKAKAFLRYYAQGESVFSASTKAGYGDGATYAYQVLHFPQAKVFLAEERRLYQEASQMTRKRVLEMHMEAFDMAKLLSEPASMVAAAREVGKLCGYYDKQIDININVKGNVTMQQMTKLSDEELLRIIEEGNREDIEGTLLGHNGSEG